MSQVGRFDTDTAALRARLDSHARYSTGDMTGWALELLGARSGEDVLDVGAGTGAQTLRLAPEVGSVLAVDASEESLALLAAAAPANVTTLAGRFDELARRDCERRFDRAISCYAMYYADDSAALLARIAALLRDDGVLFLCGPSFENNAELRAFHWRLADAEPPGPTKPATFMEETAPAICRELFAGVERFGFENPVRYDSAQALVDYWRNYNLYDPELEERFERAAAEHFEDNPEFVTAKRVVGIRARR
jgi:SAM-dependent methyltransferase